MNAVSGPAASKEAGQLPGQRRALQGLTAQARENLYQRLRAARKRLPRSAREGAARPQR